MINLRSEAKHEGGKSPSDLLSSLPPPPDGKEWIQVKVRGGVLASDKIAIALKETVAVQAREGEVVPTNKQQAEAEANGSLTDNISKTSVRIGYVWKLVTSPNQSWKEKLIVDTSSSSAGEAVALATSESASSEFIEHVITALDTLPGISLKYNVPVNTIKKSNKMYSSNDIQAYKVLRIPKSSTSFAFKQDPKEVVMQEFMEVTGEGNVESRIYLEDSSWDIKRAVKAFNDDANWAIENAHVFVNSFANSDIGYSDQ